MRCPSCGTEFQGFYCPNCSAPANQASRQSTAQCPRCGFMVYGTYCTNCGLQRHAPQPVYYYPYPAPSTQQDELRRIATASWLFYFAIFYLAFIVFIGLLWASTTEVIPGILDGACTECNAVLLIITPQPVLIIEFGGIPFVAYYIMVIFVISSCFFLLALKDLPKLLTGFRESLKKGGSQTAPRSTLMAIAQLFAFGVFFNLTYNLIVLIFFGEGAMPTQSDVGPSWYFLSLVASAAVWEELVCRTLLIGVPLLAIALIRRRAEKPSRYLVGGGFRIGLPEGFFLLFSALMFGAAHTYSGGPWVFPPLFIGGMILGYLFLKKGIVASILFHFVWNYSIAFNYMAQVTENTPMLAIGVAFNLFVAFVGLVAVIVFLVKTFHSSLAKERHPLEALYGQYPQPTAQPQSGYQCPMCGGLTATYRNGHFQCLRCGHII